ncbi:MAG TPA: formyltransferase family protein, partial [Candidatus Limnocylindrales bacterium]|nr:formyltransferase family protein [Candidatus Limnocylindrales bacterium]
MAHSGWRIVLVSTVPIVAQTLAATLRELGHRPVAVIAARRDRPMPDRPSMTDETAPAGLDLLLPASKHAIQPLVSSYEPDLLLCWGFPWKIPSTALQVPRLGSVNCHPAMLPRHRGPIPMAWALREGDGQYGVTWHRMDPELDTGAILAQSVVPMEDDDFDITVVGPRIGSVALGLL